MRMVIDVEVEVNVAEDRANVHEVFAAVEAAAGQLRRRLAQEVIEGYQRRIVELLCRSDRSGKHGLGEHQSKLEPGQRCGGREFVRAGYWSDERQLRGEGCELRFRPAMVKCVKCGRHVTPVLQALELEAYQGHTQQLLRCVMESVAETSYRRGSRQLQTLTGSPVAKSTAHRWAAKVELPVQPSAGHAIWLADGTGFKRQPGERGEVRLVLEVGEKGQIHPVGVWAGSGWDEIARDVKDQMLGQSRLLVSDGERGLEQWLGDLSEASQRCHWHLGRDVGFALWQGKMGLEERKTIRERLSRLLAIEVPADDVEMVSESDKQALRERVGGAERELSLLIEQFDQRGYTKAATYLNNARKRLFEHLEFWLSTGIVAPRTSSIIENILRELVRRLKKVGWNWSDAGAQRMGRVVMLRRYDEQAWEEYWRQRLNLRGRCQIQITRWTCRPSARPNEPKKMGR